MQRPGGNLVLQNFDRVVADELQVRQSCFVRFEEAMPDPGFMYLDAEEVPFRMFVRLLQLPEESQRPVLLRFDPSNEPIVRLALLAGDDHPGSASDEEALKAHVKTNLARYKVPRDIVFLDELPRNPTGKVLKRKLAEL